jgi:hypothetical protein
MNNNICIMDKESNEKKNKENLALTPGGFRPKSSVIYVSTKEVVRRTDDGRYVVIPKDETNFGND